MKSLDSVGWFGKLPSLGDFASRRLSSHFIEHWDAWLSSGLAAWQASAPDHWLDHYLGGPSWRFVAMASTLPGPCASTAWAGVLVPSVDRVGRYFPLTLAQPLAQLPLDTAQANALLGWLHRLDDLAVDALHDDWNIDQLEAALAREGAAPPQTADADSTLACALPGLANPTLHTRLQGYVLWITANAEPGPPRLRLDRGLPTGEDFNTLICGAPVDVTHSLQHALTHSP